MKLIILNLSPDKPIPTFTNEKLKTFTEQLVKRREKLKFKLLLSFGGEEFTAKKIGKLAKEKGGSTKM